MVVMWCHGKYHQILEITSEYRVYQIYNLRRIKLCSYEVFYSRMKEIKDYYCSLWSHFEEALYLSYTIQYLQVVYKYKYTKYSTTQSLYTE